ncbi:unnamed protein product [Linum trigynum]|uniref:Reverse transcriptase domain-containing protein n=1 Tax=Linum trigynum TaxID=586398 RepID=A0AAV2D5N0_9ROSI
MWDHLIQTSKDTNIPWLVTGDFNAYCLPEEKLGANSPASLRRCQRFCSWINQAELIDLGYSGPRFTWYRGETQATRKASRIDRSLCNVAWNSTFPNSSVQHLPKFHSDHLPLLTSVGNQHNTDYGNRDNFKFEAVWLTDNKFKDFLAANWNKEIPLQQALKEVTPKLQQWSKEVFGSVNRKKRRLLARLKGITDRLAVSFNPGLLKLQLKLEGELDWVLAQEEIVWFQRAKEKWATLGEQNTSYFHHQATRRKRRNKILALRNANGDWIDDQESLLNMVLNFYTTLYTEDGDQYEDLMPKNVFPRLQQEDSMALHRPYHISDIHKAIHDMKPYSAPGPDGYQAIFYQKFWPIVGKNLADMASSYFEIGEIPTETLDSTIVLIPKMEQPESPAQFRPICLNNVALKAITKAITNRLKPLMPKIVAPTQSGFIQGRQANDNILLLQETLHTLRRRKGKKGGLVIKIDLEKAYDRLRWDFIRDTLKEVGLASSLISRIMTCVERNKMRISWNGQLSNPIIPSRGVRQGDPLSPFLFILCMERLAHKIEQAVEAKLWKPLQLSKNGPKLSHLFFADDLVLFAEAEGSQIDIIKRCLDDFCSSSGQRVNHSKSAMFVSPNVRRDKAARLSSRAGINLTADLGRYLGITAINGRITKARYKELLLKIQNKLAAWKTRHLSMAARVTMVKAVTSNIAIYPMFSELLPVGVCKSIDRCNRSFIWGEEEDRQSFTRWRGSI